MLASPTCTAAGAWVAPAMTPGAGEVETFVVVDVVAHPNANSASIKNKNNFFTFDLLLLSGAMAGFLDYGNYTRKQKVREMFFSARQHLEHLPSLCYQTAHAIFDGNSDIRGFSGMCRMPGMPAVRGETEGDG